MEVCLNCNEVLRENASLKDEMEGMRLQIIGMQSVVDGLKMQNKGQLARLNVVPVVLPKVRSHSHLVVARAAEPSNTVAALLAALKPSSIILDDTVELDSESESEPPTQTFKEKYSIDLNKQIGRGASSVVYAGLELATQTPVAIKVINNKRFTYQKKVLEMLQREVQMLTMVQPHKHIVTILDSFCEGHETFIVMELLTGHTLAEAAETMILSEKDVKFIFCQLVEVLKHLHHNGVTHRDLKPENIILGDGLFITLVDFGTARPRLDKMSTVIGTPTCMAPEVFSGAVYDSRADIYSCGIILVILLNKGKNPFGHIANDFTSMKAAATSGDLMWDSAAVSLEAQALVQQLISPDPEKRIELHKIDTSQWLADGILVEIEQYPKLLIFWLDDAHKFPIHAIQNSSNSVFLPSYALHRAISSGTISNSKSRKGLSLKLITKVERDLYNSTVLPKMLKSTKNQYKCDQALIDFFNDQKVFYLAAEIKNFLSLN